MAVGAYLHEQTPDFSEELWHCNINSKAGIRRL